jgi:hypothetical protein
MPLSGVNDTTWISGGYAAGQMGMWVAVTQVDHTKMTVYIIAHQDH